MTFRAALILASTVLWLAQSAPAPAPPKPAPEPMLKVIARFLGVSKSRIPVLRRAPPEDGEIWLGSLDAREPQQLTEAGYRWPVFRADGQTLYALRGDALEEIPIATRRASVVRRVPGVLKLVGIDPAAPDELLIVLPGPGNLPTPAVLSIATGRQTAIGPVPKGDEVVDHLLDQKRVYEGRTVDIAKTEESAFSGRIWRWNVVTSPWTDPLTQLTHCADTDCIQPTVSADGKMFAYVRARPF
jgi:hypothetical protein